jgi:hypothetical protein
MKGKKMRPRTTKKSQIKVLDLTPKKDAKGGTAIQPDKQKLPK